MFTLNCKGRLLVLDKPVVMGILNLTPDSFFSGSRHHTEDEMLKKAEQMLNEGAAILDIGGQSTRPGSERISADEELSRVIAPIRALQKKFPDTFLSIDTFYAKVAKEAVQAGASIINDISAGSLDEEMITTAATLNVPYVLMHLKGTPQTMQKEATYADLTKELLDFFIEKLNLIRKSGIRDVIIDLGFGFGKNSSQNFELLRNLPVFRMLDCPILLGVSRKSTISKILNIPVEETLNGTTVLHTMALMNGASILRAHDVKEAVQAIKLFQAFSGK
jgi:dihydropteroate synthase